MRRLYRKTLFVTAVTYVFTLILSMILWRLTGNKLLGQIFACCCIIGFIFCVILLLAILTLMLYILIIVE